MRIYMDVCCLNRPFDEQSQDRIYLEAETILAILPHCQNGEWTLVTSDIVDFELSGMKNLTKLQKVRGICSIAKERITSTQEVRDLSKSYQNDGVKLVDSLHLALCETYGVEILLSTDDQFIRAAARIKTNTRVINPVTWLMEVNRK